MAVNTRVSAGANQWGSGLHVLDVLDIGDDVSLVEGGGLQWGFDSPGGDAGFHYRRGYRVEAQSRPGRSEATCMHTPHCPCSIQARPGTGGQQQWKPGMVLALLRRNGSGTSDAAMGFAAKELQGLPIDAALGKEMLCSALKDGMLGLGVSSPSHKPHPYSLPCCCIPAASDQSHMPCFLHLAKGVAERRLQPGTCPVTECACCGTDHDSSARPVRKCETVLELVGPRCVSRLAALSYRRGMEPLPQACPRPGQRSSRTQSAPHPERPGVEASNTTGRIPDLSPRVGRC
jgi:hypothetical protein